MLRYCFLDVDGVLNHNLQNEKDFEYFHPDNMAALKKLSELVDFKIVLSSSWRIDQKNAILVRSNLLKIGLDFIDTTPVLFSGHRRHEISHWLLDRDWDSAFILDDLPSHYCDPQINNVYFFRINADYGLTIEKSIEIAEILNAG